VAASSAAQHNKKWFFSRIHFHNKFWEKKRSSGHEPLLKMPNQRRKPAACLTFQASSVVED
jgi:hypothetical protein